MPGIARRHRPPGTRAGNARRERLPIAGRASRPDFKYRSWVTTGRCIALAAAFASLSSLSAPPARAAAQPAPGAPDTPAATTGAPAAITDAPVCAPKEAPAETPIAVPPLLPTGFLFAWKPMFLTVRVDNGVGSTFGSDKLQGLRGLARYTFPVNESWPFVGRVELEGGQFTTDQVETPSARTAGTSPCAGSPAPPPASRPGSPSLPAPV